MNAPSQKKSPKAPELSPVTCWILLLAAFLAGLAAIFFANSVFYSDHLKRTGEIANTVIPEHGTAWIELDFGNGSKRLFEGNLRGRAYPLLTGLDAAADAGNFRYKIGTGKIVSLAGIQGNWKIYKNNGLITDPVDKIILEKGDQYSLRRE